MRSPLRAALAGTVLFLLAGCEPTRYEQADFSNPDAIRKNADTYWKREGFWGGVKGVKTVAITQFNVEYVTSQTSRSGADALSVLGVMEMAGMGKRQKQFAEDFKQEFPTLLYAQFVDALRSEGFDVVPMEKLTGHPAFAELKAAAAGGSYSQNDRGLLGQQDRNNSSKIQVYPVRGLPLPDDGFFNLNAGNNLKAEWKIAGDSGAQAAIRVRIRVGIDDDGRAVIGGGSTVLAVANPEKQNWTGTPEWVFKDRGAMTGHGSMRDDVPVIDAKEFKAFQGDVYTVNGPKFQESILKMYPAYSRMAAIKLKG